MAGGACIAGGMHDREGMRGRRACVAGGVHGRGACMAEGGQRGRRDSHCSGQYTSYWNAFLYLKRLFEPATSCLRDRDATTTPARHR